MPKGVVSSLVFHGQDFSASMFETRDFQESFGPRPEDQTRIGPYGRFRYAKGTHEFRIDEDSIELLSYEPNRILPEVLMRAAQEVIRKLKTVRCAVSSIMITCSCIFSAQEIGHDGVIFCGTLTDSPLTRKFLSQSPTNSMTTGAIFALLFDHVWYTVNIEPDAESHGKDLIVSIDANQHIRTLSQLEKKVQAFTRIRNQIFAIHNHLRNL